MRLIDEFALAITPEFLKKNPSLADGQYSTSVELASRIYIIARALARESTRKRNRLRDAESDNPSITQS